MSIESGPARAAGGRPRTADHRRDPRIPNVVAAVGRSDTGQRTRGARSPAPAAAVRPRHHGRAASAPPGSVGHRRVGGGRQHRRRRRPADRQVDVPADAGAVGRGHPHAEAGAVLLRRPRRRRPDVPRGPSARRRCRDALRTRPGQPCRRGDESRSAPTRKHVQAAPRRVDGRVPADARGPEPSGGGRSVRRRVPGDRRLAGVRRGVPRPGARRAGPRRAGAGRSACTPSSPRRAGPS